MALVRWRSAKSLASSGTMQCAMSVCCEYLRTSGSLASKSASSPASWAKVDSASHGARRSTLRPPDPM